MKKILLFVLVSLMVVSLFAGCAGNAQKEDVTNAPETSATEPAETTATETDGAVATGAVKTGLGQFISIAQSASASVNEDGAPVNALAQMDAIMAAVTVDSEGKIVSVKIDNAQVKINFDSKGQLVSDPSASVQTKVELGDAYGMKKASGIGKEWYEQIAALEDWMAGKTIDEIMAMKTFQKDDAHPAVPEEADLTSSITLSVEGYLEAVKEAVEKAQSFDVEVTGTAKTGLGSVVSIAKSASATADADASGQVDVVMAAVTVDEAGKIVGVLIDNGQVKVNFDAKGTLITDTAVNPLTKVELGNDYGMKKASSIGKEWFEQIDALGKWMIGKTIDEVMAVKTFVKDEAHPAVPEDADLTSSVTLSIESYLEAVQKAVQSAK